MNNANLRDLITANGPVIVLKLDLNLRFFGLCKLEIPWMISKNNRAPLLYYTVYSKLYASFQSHQWIETGVNSPEALDSGQNRWFFVPCDLEIWWMTLNNNRAPLLTYFKLCASFRSHWWNQTGVTVRKHPIWVNIGNFLSPVTFKCDRWPWKTIGHLFYATLSYVHHFVAIGEFKPGLQSGNGPFGEKLALTSVTLTFDLWPWSFAWPSLLSMVMIP